MSTKLVMFTKRGHATKGGHATKRGHATKGATEVLLLFLKESEVIIF